MKPKQLFLIDSLGGFLSAFVLGIVLIRFESYVGMLPRILFYLSAIAFVYGLFSMGCYLFVNKKQRLFLRIIATANVLYCCLTTICVVMNYEKLTTLGLSYFLIEMIVIGLLARLELRM